jgi:hypothetical protein
MSSKEIYVSTDVEADGPIPGPNSMLSFGSAAYAGGKELIGTFSANLETLPGATADPRRQNGAPDSPRPGPRRQELEMPETAMRRYLFYSLPSRDGETAPRTSYSEVMLPLPAPVKRGEPGRHVSSADCLRL